ncbi:MAG: carboxylesterase family protein [Lachnospiraceae bacterium]|nr:carboxylesterase family protein [Lachnospiraceae bacterium]
MKKLFTIDDFMVAAIAALGYGFGETIARLSGLSELLCVAASFALGIVLEEIISKIVFSEAVQKKPMNRVLTYIIIFIIFIIAHSVSVVWMGVSMLDYLSEEFLYVVGLPILGFVVNLLIRAYRVRKIRKLYGDGREGFVFDVKKEDIEEVNRQNQAIQDEYDADLSVKTRTGIFVGKKSQDTIVYLGIPYAKPPVGELRWKAPEPLPSSNAVFEAKNFGASAIQVEHPGVILKHHRQSEDCLTLNLCVGAQKSEVKKPVLVLFHYGDFTYGGAVDPLLDGTNFVNEHPGIVVVSFNFRLGIFGFIDFSEIPGGKAYPDALNLGLLDQIAALEWIRENIAAFGGDPERVTVLGFESGATCICMLAACKKAKGLFKKAVVFNGSLKMTWDTPQGPKDLAKSLLKETKAETMEELCRLETDALKDAAQKLWQNMCAPTCDGALIPSDVYQAYRNGEASDIEFIVGISGKGTKVFRSFIGDQRYAQFISAVVTEMQNSMDDPSIPDELKENIRALADGSIGPEEKSMLIEQWLALGVYHGAEKLSEGGNTVHLLYWDEEPLIENLGSGTVDVTAVLLGNTEALSMYGNVLNADLSETLQSLLRKFISGNPLQLYHNEIKGFDGLTWKAFPKALIVSDENIVCDTIKDR